MTDPAAVRALEPDYSDPATHHGAAYAEWCLRRIGAWENSMAPAFNVRPIVEELKAAEVALTAQSQLLVEARNALVDAQVTLTNYMDRQHLHKVVGSIDRIGVLLTQLPTPAPVKGEPS